MKNKVIWYEIGGITPPINAVLEHFFRYFKFRIIRR
nr:MAG TPA: hypothetical protein [Caudoviricetes sp.]DAK99299.1 MAG TPA: hypothetical protein [Caudoviricetes sp.]